MEKTVVLVKPDGLQRGLVGEIMHRFERKGMKLVAVKMFQLNDDILDEWYANHKEKSFFKDLKAFMMWTPIIAMVWEGLEVIPAVRKIIGTTKGREAEAGSIRGDFGMSGSFNLIHASDSTEAAEKEMKLIFKKDEIFNYENIAQALIYDKSEK